MTPSSLPTMPKAHGLISVDDIIIPDRIRSEDTAETKVNIKQLHESIGRIGLIQPIVLEDDEKTLVAGWCRLSACKLLGYTEVAYCVRSELTPAEKVIAEFEENTHRGEMSWQDQVCAIAKIHEMLKAEHKGRNENWDQKATGRVLKQSSGRVSYCLVLARAIKTGNTYVSKSTNVSEALARLAEQKAAEIDQRQAELGPAAMSTVPLRKRDAGTSGFVTSGSSSVLPSVSFKQESTSPTSEDPLDFPDESLEPEDVDVSFAINANITVPLKELCLNGKMEEVCEVFPNNVFDLIFTDIPYGISIDKMGSSMNNLDLVKDEHEIDEFLVAGPKWLKTMFRVLKDNTYCIFFYDVAHHEKLIQWAQDAGFIVQPYPFIWIKTHPCSNMNAGVWFTKTVEYVMICRKGRATMQNSSYSPCHFESSGAVDRQLWTHPFFKPFDLCTHLLKKVGFRGMKMLDPFAGEGSIIKSAIYQGMTPYGIELSPNWYPKLLATYRNTYQEIYKGNVSFS